MQKKGMIYGVVSYLMWGFFPLYFKALKEVPALEIIFHRVAWSFVFVALIMTLRQEWGTIKGVFTQSKLLLLYTLAAVLLATNWLLYVWAVNTGHVVESSLGYFINPLLSVAMGVILLREKLRPMQWVPIGLAAAGVLYLTIQYGSLPWIALGLAFSFGLYGLVKKISPLPSVQGLTVETAILFLPSFAYLAFLAARGQGALGYMGWGMSLLLAGSGVLTSVPLLMFATAAHEIPLSVIGLLQYIAPTCQFLLGVLVFKEAFTGAQVVGFSLIWLALIVFSLESMLVQRQTALARAG